MAQKYSRWGKLMTTGAKSFAILFWNFGPRTNTVHKFVDGILYRENIIFMTGACSGKPDSLDYDSGARDMSPEPASLQQLVESHHPRLLSIVQDDSIGMEILDVANRVSIFCMHIIYGKYVDLCKWEECWFSQWTENCKNIVLFGCGQQSE